ncbi:RNA-binding cell elongation regulator Jag/EloR [Evtepia sp.]|uniref:RNA-binding cell elongation regulator Jag/EloR n=1 Tax=Evtepia sp. TaxID=2773933 RepID=UPI003F161D28
MLKWIEATGRTEDAAVQNALAELGLDRDSVSVEVLERARSGFLGFGSSPAKVKVTYEVPDEEPVVKAAPAAEETVIPAAPVEEETPAPAAEEASPAPQPVVNAKGVDLEDRIRAFLSGLLDHMGVEAEINISPKAENGVLVTLEGPKLGALIGHRGETLDAIQQLTNYAVNRGRTHRVRIHIDAENYRAKREESLKRLANKVAAKVVKYRRNITLEPMNAYERHVIHETLQDYPDVITYSTGTEPNRRTVVAFSRGKHAY